MHLSDADLAAALDPSGGGTGGLAARAHAATCEACASALETARIADREVGELLHLLDHPVPAIGANSLAWRAGAGSDSQLHVVGAPALPTIARGRWRGAGRRGARLPAQQRNGQPGGAMVVAVRRSAVILALSAAVAAAAAPHSPVRQFIVRLVGQSQPAPVAVTPAAAPQTPSVSLAPTPPRGVAITAGAGFDLVFRSSEPSGLVHVRPITGNLVSVTASADGPTYTVGTASIIVDPHGVSGVTYDVELPPPAALPRVSIRVGDRVIFERDGNAVHADGQPRADGTYTLPLGH